MFRMKWKYYILILLHLLHLSFCQLELCPTRGMDAYALFTITDDVDFEGFSQLLKFYRDVTPYGNFNYAIYFGDQMISKNDDSLVDAIDSWLDNDQKRMSYYNSSIVPITVANKSDDVIRQNDCSHSCVQQRLKNLLDQIDAANQDGDKVTKKKQMILITDYVHEDVVDILNNATNANIDIYGIYYEYNNLLNQYLHYPTYTMKDTAAIVRPLITGTIDFVMTSTVDPIIAFTSVWMLGPFNQSMINTVIDSFTYGSLCSLTDNELAAHFIRVVYRNAVNNTQYRERWIPWIGSNTYSYADYCLSFVQEYSSDKNDIADAVVYQDFINSSYYPSTLPIFNALVSTLPQDVLSLYLYNSPPTYQDHLTIISDIQSDTLYEDITYYLESGTDPLISQFKDVQIISFNASYMVENNLTLCRDHYTKVSLIDPKVFHKPKEFKIAMFDLVWITALAAFFAILTGVIIYWRARRLAMQQDKEDEITLFNYPVSKVNTNTPSADRMPWEVKEYKVKIDLERLLGGGVRSNVYLGHLLGKAPLMQWSPRSNFENCDIAIRVTREYGTEEEDELSREISSMQRLRGHDNLSMFLGWAILNGAVCSLLELTPSTLSRYLMQQKNTLLNDIVESTKENAVEKLKDIASGVASGLEYIHSRHLIHRDICARNILLSADLKPKIAAFQFCSNPKDPKFREGQSTLLRLSLKWQSPEALHGEFSYKSDIWSLGMLLFELFSLGDHPLSHINDNDLIRKSIEKGFRCEAPPLFPSSLWQRTTKTWLATPSNRPTIHRLKAHIIHSKTNEAFELEEE